MKTVEELLKELNYNIRSSSVGDLALTWIYTHPEEEQSGLIRIFQQFWTRGIVIAREEMGLSLTVDEFKKQKVADVLEHIKNVSEWRGDELNKRMTTYMAFRDWIMNIANIRKP